MPGTDLTPARLEQLLAAATPGPWSAQPRDMFGDHNIVAPPESLAVAAAVSNLRPVNMVTANAALIALSPSLAARVIELEGEVARLRRALEAAIGYMTNAAIDLKTGAAKKTGLDTINGGIARARTALEARHD